MCKKTAVKLLFMDHTVCVSYTMNKRWKNQTRYQSKFHIEFNDAISNIKGLNHVGTSQMWLKGWHVDTWFGPKTKLFILGTKYVFIHILHIL